MCGICGYVGSGQPETLAGMVSTLYHRGPDDVGLWHSPRASLGMRRLAIIDIDHGHQPVWNEDRTIAAVFNGEIYNHVELRRTLEEQGHRFRTSHSDTEVIVHLYEQHGLDFLDHLNGMFAIALWDGRTGSLVLARDHVGIKPLYYARTSDGLVFGSEPKALLRHPDVSAEPDFEALHHYFSLKNIPAPNSAYRAIAQLRGGERLVWQDGGMEKRRWWRPDFTANTDLDETAAADHLADLLRDSVRLQMRSDVPVGAYLSGGIDSSSVVALMSEQQGSAIKTFTLVYPDETPNKASDRQFARRIAGHYGTEHHEFPLDPQELVDSIGAVLASFDEPFSGVVSTYFISRLISRHVKVALSGDGADELFGSYLPHRLAQPMAAVLADPRLLEHVGPEARSRLAPFDADRDRLYQLAARGTEANWRMSLYLADEHAKRTLYTPAMRDAVGSADTACSMTSCLDAAGTADPLNRMLHLDQQTLLPDQVLAFVDRLSMAPGLEVRPPFLDRRIVQFAASLPGNLKIREGRVKHILKQAVRGLLPADLIDRPKEGFVMPVNDWMLDRLRPFVDAALAPERLKRSGILDPAAVASLLARFHAGEHSLNNRIWNLVCFQIWWETCQR